MTKNVFKENENIFIMSMRNVYEKDVIITNTSILCGNHSVENIQSRKALILLKKAKDRRITTYNTHIWSFIYMSLRCMSRQFCWAVNSPFAFGETTQAHSCSILAHCAT